MHGKLVKIGLAQINATVGDLAGNSVKIREAYESLVARGAELVVTPELAVTGYPPRDLVFKSRFVPDNLKVVEELEAAVGAVPLVVGFVEPNTSGTGNPFYNSAAVLQRGKARQVVRKTLLPTYDVFDEDRYFEPASSCTPVVIDGHRIGITICEDIWTEKYLHRRLYAPSPARDLVRQRIDMLLNLSASPFHTGKPAERVEMISGIAHELGVPVAYCNAVGGNDQLVFDGNSLAFGPGGELLASLGGFKEVLNVVDFVKARPLIFHPEDKSADIYEALVLGIRDYCRKTGFKSAVLGLSGGIDSALVATLAAAALGPENVVGVTMPSGFSSKGSVDDSVALAKNLGIRLETIPIEKLFTTLKGELAPVFAGRPEDLAEENMQSRLRAIILMSLSNKFGHLLLTTGNKSEMAVGYCTIYGDMCGGLAAISDLPKTTVYRLCRWINRKRVIIPVSTIDKPPSAELRPDQKDQDTLPPYELLDAILELYVEQSLSTPDIIAQGYDAETVKWIVRRVDLNEWKRHQAAPGLRVTSKAFGTGRRIPIAQKFVG